jgi:hypothetical protein
MLESFVPGRSARWRWRSSANRSRGAGTSPPDPADPRRRGRHHEVNRQTPEVTKTSRFTKPASTRVIHRNSDLRWRRSASLFHPKTPFLTPSRGALDVEEGDARLVTRSGTLRSAISELVCAT